jgi:N-acetylneuraminate synthase
VDSGFSLTPEELSLLVEETKRAAQSLGRVSYGPTVAEIPSLQFRRSIFFATDLAEGTVLTKAHLRVVRPGLGLPPKFLDLALGTSLRRDASRGSPLTWSHLFEVGNNP